MFKILLKLLNIKKITETATVDSIVSVDDVCYHRIQDRVRTHRGYHCNKCGKRL